MTRLTTLPATFSLALRFLRKRARLTQDALGLAVGYSREQIARLENGSRLPDLAVVAALFIPALFAGNEEELAEQFLSLAGQTRTGRPLPPPRRPVHPQPPGETHPVPAAPRRAPPAPLLPLIGRECELEDLLAVLQTARLVTVLGAPGIGKSRLALEAANQVLPTFSNGAAFISLAEACSPEDVPHAVLRALEITPSAHQPVEAAIRAYLAPLHLLLVLDNCEHLLPAAPLFTDWLAHAPRLKLLCTSRVPLDLYGEQEWPLSPLSIPDLAQPPDLEEWGKLPALRLLVERGRAANPSFALTDENLLPLAALCVALDGLPLALELAAVRLRHLPPNHLVQQLLALRGSGQLSSTWLQQSRRNVAERHRTLQAAIHWSLRHLPPDQQAAFTRLGVFIGGCSSHAAQVISGASPQIIAQLERANLVQAAAGRISLLETLRVFAAEQLSASGQLLSLHSAHAAYYSTFAGQVFTGLLGGEQSAWMQRALADHDNCLAALRWTLAHKQGALAIALAGSLWWFWCRRGLFLLGREMLSAALQLTTPDLAARATALNGLASVHLALDEYAASLECHRQGLDLRRQLGDAAGAATVLHNMGLTAYMMGEYAQAITWLDESIAADPDSDPMQAWAHKGIIALDRLDLQQARCWLEQAHDLVMRQPEGWAQAFVMHNLADVLLETGELESAQQLAQASLAIFTALGDSYYMPDPQFVLAKLAAAKGDAAAALDLSAQALVQYEARQDLVLSASVRLFRARLAKNLGDPKASEQIQQARTLRQSSPRPLTPREQRHYAAQ